MSSPIRPRIVSDLPHFFKKTVNITYETLNLVGTQLLHILLERINFKSLANSFLSMKDELSFRRGRLEKEEEGESRRATFLFRQRRKSEVALAFWPRNVFSIFNARSSTDVGGKRKK